MEIASTRIAITSDFQELSLYPSPISLTKRVRDSPPTLLPPVPPLPPPPEAQHPPGVSLSGASEAGTGTAPAGSKCFVMMGCVLGAGRLIGAPWGGWVRSGQPAALGGSSRRFCERGAGGGRSGPRVEATCFKSPKCGETRCGDLGGVPAACCGGVASLRRCYGAVAELGEFLFWGRSEGASGAELSKTGFQLDNSRLSCIFLNCFCWVGGDHRPTIHHAKN